MFPSSFHGLVLAAGVVLADPGSPAPAPPAAKTHWAFIAPQRPAAPVVSRAGWAKNPLDVFVLARLEKEGIEPSPEADRAALLRRLSLDLVGLPPEPAEVDAFAADERPDAFERQVERLLASPHYGERWARHWLDAARYADSNGYEKDRAREMWHYRDWVVDALNRDLPYDRFITEQIAGDLLPGSTQDQLVATGLLRNSMINEEGAIDPEQFRMESMFDRMDCIGKSILGLTIQCAQCHNHKYDPLSQKEYYRLFAFINNDDELTAPFYTPGELARRDEVLRGIRDEEEKVKLRLPNWRERLARWEEEASRGRQTSWTVLESYEHGDPGGLSKLRLQKDLSLLAGGHRFGGGTWRVRARTEQTGITAVRLEVFTNANLPMRGPGRSGQGLFALRELRLEVARKAEPAKTEKVAFTGVAADFEEPERNNGTPPADANHRRFGPAKFAGDGDDKTAWTIDAGPGRRNADRKAVFRAKDPFGFPGGTELTFHLAMDDEVACFRLSVSTDADATVDPLPRRVRDALAVPRDRRTELDNAAIFSQYLASSPDCAEEKQRIEDLWKRFPEASGTSLVLSARPEFDPRPTHVLTRGDWLKPLDAVPPGVPAVLHQLPEGAPPSRLSFAEWLCDRRSPTSARVLVNRLWLSYFGAGIVSTVEDFGIQGTPPTHPDLLDWLSSELMDPQVRLPGEDAPRPWSVKHLHRLIAGSATYRQSSLFRAEGVDKDPQNLLFWRGPRVRVEGEVVRDIALAASGLLNRSLGGPSVFSPAPQFLFKPPTSFEAFSWNEATGPDRYRRALYTFRRRSTPYPVLQIFDAPSGESSCARRQSSNTPLQALATLNETLFVETARALARKTLELGGKSERDRIAFAFRCVLSRPPSARESDLLASLLARQRRRIAEGWINSSELGTGKNETPADLPAGATPAELAAYTVLARVILNLDETITKE